MTNAANSPAATIRARVHDSALKRVTRFFSSTLYDIFTETLQNARRAGATRGLSAPVPSPVPRLRRVLGALGARWVPSSLRLALRCVLRRRGYAAGCPPFLRLTRA